MTLSRIRSIALINTLGDYGINAYCFELAEGLASQGVDVDLYTGGASPLSELPAVRHHRCFPVLGSVLFKRQLSPVSAFCSSPPNGPNTPDRAPELSSLRNSGLWAGVRQRFLQLELARHLKGRGYDLIWTQWPDVYGPKFWSICKILGMVTAHTVHNVLPHEYQPRDMSVFRRVYANSQLLVVHSEWSKRELVRLFPEVQQKVLVAPHGMYTVYPRKPEVRQEVRRELDIADGQVACLMCGGIRPYKNLEAVLGALADVRCDRTLLIVAGEESGYSNISCSDRLARTRALAEQLGVAKRVRLIPRFLGSNELADLLEATDILVLPYVKHYGSGLLLLGMTFGKYIVATDTGGTREYLSRYPRHTLLQAADPSSVAEGLREAAQAVALEHDVAVPHIVELQWSVIARTVLTMIENAL